MSVPWNLTFAAWIPFPIVGIVGFFLAFLYYAYFRGKCSVFPGFVCILLVVLSFLIVIMIPVDVYLVSATKASNGSRYIWANNASIHRIENMVLDGYYALYGLMLVVIFFFLPFAYFNNPPPDSVDTETASNSTLARALSSTLLSFVFLCILFVIGIFVPLGNLPGHDSAIYHQLNYLQEFDCWRDVLERGFTFVINCLGLIGLLCSMIYTACGMSILPINLIKGKPKDKRQTMDLESSVKELMDKIKDLTDQHASQQPLGEVDRVLLNQYSRQLSALQSQGDTMRHRRYSSLAWCKHVWRPFQVFIGILLLLLSLLIVVDISISNINRSISSMGIYAGYMCNKTVLLNPINALLLLCHQVFPLDFIVLGAIIMYFTVSSVAGIQHMGMWFFWIKIHVLRAGRSTVRALLFSALVLATVTIYSSVLAYTLAPQYVTYGTQMYRLYPPLQDYETKSSIPSSLIATAPCSTSSPAEECTMTRLMTFQMRLFYRMWFFGVAYFWCTWLFVLVLVTATCNELIGSTQTLVTCFMHWVAMGDQIFIIGCIVSTVRARKTVAQIMMRNNREQDESLEHLILE